MLKEYISMAINSKDINININININNKDISINSKKEEIAKKIKISKGVESKITLNSEINVKKIGRKKIEFTPCEKNDLMTMYKERISYREMEEKYNVSRRTIAKFFDKLIADGLLEDRNFKFTDYEIEDFMIMYKARVSYKKMGEKYNVGRKVVENKIKKLIKNGLLEDRNFKFTDYEIQDLMIMYKARVSYKKMGEKYNVGRTAITTQIKKLLASGLLEDRNFKFTDYEIEDIISMYEDDISQEDIGNKYNVSRKVIEKKIKELILQGRIEKRKPIKKKKKSY